MGKIIRFRRRFESVEFEDRRVKLINQQKELDRKHAEIKNNIQKRREQLFEGLDD